MESKKKPEWCTANNPLDDDNSYPGRCLRQSPTTPTMSYCRGCGFTDILTTYIEKSEPVNDAVTQPSHYQSPDGTMEVKNVINAWGYGQAFWTGNALKYILRSPYKGKAQQDISKAIECLQNLLQILDNDTNHDAPERQRSDQTVDGEVETTS